MRVKNNSTDLHGHKKNKVAKGDTAKGDKNVSSPAKSSATAHQVGRVLQEYSHDYLFS